ncbi:arginyl-tRNA-protein transferase [Fulvimarina pelagi HTCC2506]|uniref:Arginyl-tRNA-protein transferase n=1 Tax=Fulvimarina pelagi HTCC2506 TaxID=314231 RepID=Q0G6G7_9HYPH|nr:arginyl-tRNA-protein transferase [Fulvimarina pelagi HTCC2506]
MRILTDEFRPGKSFRRILNRNEDLVSFERNAEPTSEQYSLFRSYIDDRHLTGGMSEMSVLDYAMMVEDSQVETRVIEYRRRVPGAVGAEAETGELIAVALSDVMSDGLSMVYSFFEPDAAERSLGTYMILDHIERALNMGLPYLYLGYWVEGSPKMNYKIRFQPQEHLMPKGWERYRG